MHRHTVPFVPFSICRLLNVGHQCATCRTLAVHAPRRCHSASAHGEQLHRHTAKSSIVTRRTAPPSHGIHPCIHPYTYIHPYVTSPQVFGPCPLLLLAARGLHRHTAADYIVTRLRTISSHAADIYRHTVLYAAEIYRHTLRTHIVTWCKMIRKNIFHERRTVTKHIRRTAM